MTTNTSNAVAVPLAPQFNVGEDWEIYVERLKQYFVANPSIDDKRKAAILLTSISTEVYKIIKNSLYPDKPDAKSFDDLVEECNSQFKPIVSSFAERGRFYEARQRDGESVAEWANRVRSLSMQCDFDEHLAHTLKDKFVCGLIKGPILEKVYELKVTSTLAECIEAAQRREMTLKEKAKVAECFELRSSRPRNHTGPKSKHVNRTNSKALCFACAQSGHNFKSCKYKQYKCKICKMVGHIATACSSQPGRNGKKTVNHLAAEIQSDGEECEFQLFNILNSAAGENRFKADLMVNEKNIRFEIDTGACVSVLSDKLYTQHFSDLPLRKCSTILKTYDGSLIKPCWPQFSTMIKCLNVSF